MGFSAHIYKVKFNRKVVTGIKKLTTNQKVFCENYITNGFNATQAYLIAFAKSTKNEVTARTNANKLLKRDYIKEYIELLQEKVEEKSIMNIQERQEYLTRVMMGEETESFMDKDGYVVDVPPRMADRLRAMDILNKMNGAYTTNSNINVTNGVNIKIVPDSDD